jgi:hypothetical protein
MLNRRISTDCWALWFALTVLSGLVVIPCAAGAPAEKGRDCGSYYMDRVAFLLGCCGDVTPNPPGPPFPAPLSKAQRAMLALNAISLAQKRGCVDSASRKHLSLRLESVGAHIMLAQALSVDAMTQTSGSGVARGAAAEADSAMAILKAFTRQHPIESAKVWSWIAEAFRQAGNPWESLAFLSGLDANCCDPRQVARFKGDFLFDLGVVDAASVAYSRWLVGRGPSDFCGEEISLRNASELRRGGFTIPEPLVQPQGVCMPSPGWQPYVVFREKEAAPAPKTNVFNGEPKLPAVSSHQ